MTLLCFAVAEWSRGVGRRGGVVGGVVVGGGVGGLEEN